LVPAMGITAANVPEATLTGGLAADLAAQETVVAKAPIDRAATAARG
jgi:acyl-CoA reductase-like NAD-dependent aldehyde dehydrogenase